MNAEERLANPPYFPTTITVQAGKVREYVRPLKPLPVKNRRVKIALHGRRLTRTEWVMKESRKALLAHLRKRVIALYAEEQAAKERQLAMMQQLTEGN